MILIPLLSSILLMVAIVIFLELTPKQITEDIFKILNKKQTLRDRVKAAQGKKKINPISKAIHYFNNAMEQSGKGKEFATVCSLSILLFVVGGIVAILLKNYFLIPIFSVAFAMFPFLYIKKTLDYYEKQLEEEMETALSIITNSYIRSNDIELAIQENITYLRPPIKEMFQSFLVETTAIRSDTKQALSHLKDKAENTIFKEWVETLIQCQNDRTLNDTLLPIVAKLTDVRIVNNELKTILYEPKKEYYMMVLMVLGNIPLLYVLNKSWYQTLMFSTAGKIVLALCGVVILVTYVLMMKYTKPIEYRR